MKVSAYLSYTAQNGSNYNNKLVAQTLNIPIYITCNPNCAECSLISTNCTRCHSTTYLYNQECIPSPCPTGFSDNADEWWCQEIRSFESGTTLQLMNIIEVERIGEYKLILKPEVELRSDGVELRINHPNNIYIGTTCTSNIGTCSISGDSRIYITNFLSTDYTAGDTPIELEISNTFTNPGVTYLYSEIEFVVETWVNATLYHTGVVNVSGSGGTGTRYTPHILGYTPTSLISSSSTTVSLSALTFNLSNKDYPIPMEYKLILTFPTDLGFTSTTPTYTPLENTGGSVSICAYPTMEITNAISNSVAANSDIIFSVDNILSPYTLGVSNSIRVDIAPGNGSIHEKYFTLDTGLTVDITNISPFSTFNVIPSSYITSDQSIYEFSVTTDIVGLNTSHRIYFKLPDTVRECSSSTIIATQGISSPIIAQTYDSTTKYYSFPIPSAINPQNLFKFEIECLFNPETTQITDEFVVQVAVITTGDIFYLSRGSPITMNSLNIFGDAVISMTDNRPLVNNTFSLTITRTANYPSTHIDQLQIIFPNYMNISSASYSLISGITVGTVTFTVTGQVILIGGITQLLQVFCVELLDIQNPPLSSDEIILNVLTLHSDGTQGEQTDSNILHTDCDFPCETCEVSTATNCLSCFPANDPVHPIIIPEAYFLVPNLKQCLDNCPSTYYENQTAVCDLCDPNSCKDCDITSTNCTSCYPNKFLHMYSCITPCPPHYYQNDIDWLCQRNIYIYIYIVCHPSCANCSSILETGCTLCYPDYYLFFDWHCGQCPTHTYFEPNVKDCRCTIFTISQIKNKYIACDYRCGECTGPSNTQCVICSSSSLVILSSVTGYCECQIGYFSDYITGACKSIYL